MALGSRSRVSGDLRHHRGAPIEPPCGPTARWQSQGTAWGLQLGAAHRSSRAAGAWAHSATSLMEDWDRGSDTGAGGSAARSVGAVG